LTTEPLRIDVLIIRKQRDAVIRKNIAAIFRTINICEFKSPDDSFSVEDYYKICAYANLYRALHRKDPVTASPIEMRDMTLTISVTARPEALIKHFEDVRKYTVREAGQGIIHVTGDVMPIQILENGLLPEEENLWLRSLSGARGIDSFVKMISRTRSLSGLVNMDAFTYAVSLASKSKIKEAIKVLAIPQDLREEIENSWLGEEIAEKGVKRGIKQGVKQGVKQCIEELANLQRAGYSLDEALAVIREKENFN
jgi:hypothetical protein